MNVGHYNTYNFIDQIFDQFDKCYNDQGNEYWKSKGYQDHKMTETDDAFEYTLDVPGFSEKDLSVSYDTKSRVLKISGETKTRKISRSIRMNKINPDKIDVEVKNGILTLHLPKTEDEKTRVVRVL